MGEIVMSVTMSFICILCI